MLSNKLFASSKVCAAPQTWYRGSRPIIATKPCSLMMVSPTATTWHGARLRELGDSFSRSHEVIQKIFTRSAKFVELFVHYTLVYVQMNIWRAGSTPTVSDFY